MAEMKPKASKRRAPVPAACLHPVAMGDEVVHVALPAESTTHDEDAVRETESFVKTLDANRQIARGRGALPPGTTHRLEKDAEGRKQLVRKRFSAI